LPILFALMLINGKEAEGQLGNPPMLWTREITAPWYIHIGNCDHAGSPSFDRRHFGFPCWAMILDVSSTNESWYAKLCWPRLFVNWLISAGIAGILITGVHIAKRKKSEQSPGGDSLKAAPQE